MDKVEVRGSLKRVLFYSGRLELSRTSYDTDLTAAEGEQLAPLVPSNFAAALPCTAAAKSSTASFMSCAVEVLGNDFVAKF
jgi:hypothetical protein